MLNDSCEYSNDLSLLKRIIIDPKDSAKKGDGKTRNYSDQYFTKHSRWDARYSVDLQETHKRGKPLQSYGFLRTALGSHFAAGSVDLTVTYM